MMYLSQLSLMAMLTYFFGGGAGEYSRLRTPIAVSDYSSVETHSAAELPVYDSLLQYGCTTGSINFERYLNAGSGPDLVDLYAAGSYPAMPDEYGYLTAFVGPISYGDNYGTRVRGYFVPPVTDDYLFTITGDDEILFKMSRSADPSGARFPDLQINSWTNTTEYNKETGQNSASRSLVAGTRYYVELLMKEGNGGDHFRVLYRNTAVTTHTIIPGSMLMPFYCDGGPTTYCNKGETVEVRGTALNGYTATMLTLPDPTSISDVEVVATYRGNYGGDSLVVTDDLGNPHTLHYMPKRSDSLFIYRGALPATGSITLTPTINPYAARTLTANVQRTNQPAPYAAATQQYVVAEGYQGSVQFDLTLPKGNYGPRDVTLTIPVVSREASCGRLEVTATAGGVTADTISYGQGTDKLELLTLTIPNVSENTTLVSVELTSPTGTETGCPPQSGQDGHAFTVAGLVTVNISCPCAPICLPVQLTRS